MSDTIAAIASPQGMGGVCVLRLSGKEALRIAKRFSGKEDIKPRHAYFSAFKNIEGEVLDQGLLLYFKAPNSFTGEDVVEFQGHGGVALARALLNALLDFGARMAEAGEFTQRAFLNNKIDLLQAEAIADLIHAQSLGAIEAAQRVYRGDFSKALHALSEEILHLRVYVEAALDFPEEEIDFLAESTLLKRFERWGDDLSALLVKAKQGNLLSDGVDIVLAGRPNVGKSSLLNALSGEDYAIVTPVAGTTRDIVRAQLVIEGIPVRVLDTAGLRESEDAIEMEGIRRSHEALQKAQLIAFLSSCDASFEEQEEDEKLLLQLEAMVPNTPILYLQNKLDLSENLKLWREDALLISAKTGEGLDVLRKNIADVLGKQEIEAPFIARERHLRILKEVEDLFLNAKNQLVSHQAGELLAQDLRFIHDKLGMITGKVSSEDLLGEIFSGFCIGK